MFNPSSLTASHPIAQAIATEANRAIASLELAAPADRTAVESVLESLREVSRAAAPELTTPLQLRLVAVRNNLATCPVHA